MLLGAGVLFGAIHLFMVCMTAGFGVGPMHGLRNVAVNAFFLGLLAALPLYLIAFRWASFAERALRWVAIFCCAISIVAVRYLFPLNLPLLMLYAVVNAVNYNSRTLERQESAHS